MSNFASIKFINEFDKVTYYSLVINGEEDEESLFEAFIKKFTPIEIEKLNHILSWLREIGDKYGAQRSLFREENYASALPPSGINKKPTYTEDDVTTGNPLRLYCHRLNDHVVLLFNGGIKTAAAVQDCANVRMPFILANKLSKLVDDRIRDGDIEWEDDLMDIKFEENYKLYY